MQNPFTLTFGESPLVPIERPVQTNEIVDAFTAEPANQQMFILTGVRGSGKTVMLTEISRKLEEREDWVVIKGIADAGNGRIKDIRALLKMETNEFNPYRKRLIKKGLISGETRGYVTFTLPLFREYAMTHS